MTTKEILQEIDTRAEKLWRDLPNADSDPADWTAEEHRALGAYTELEQLAKTITSSKG